jgi:hypothetical protein
MNARLLQAGTPWRTQPPRPQSHLCFYFLQHHSVSRLQYRCHRCWTLCRIQCLCHRRLHPTVVPILGWVDHTHCLPRRHIHLLHTCHVVNVRFSVARSTSMISITNVFTVPNPRHIEHPRFCTGYVRRRRHRQQPLSAIQQYDNTICLCFQEVRTVESPIETHNSNLVQERAGSDQSLSRSPRNQTTREKNPQSMRDRKKWLTLGGKRVREKEKKCFLRL